MEPPTIVAQLPFRPKGDKPEWELIYESLLSDVEFDTVITYGQLDKVLGRPFERSRSPLYRAREHLGDVRHRWLEVVPGVGYRVIQADEHLKVAEKHKRRAKRQLGQMVRVGDVTDLSRLSAEQLAHHDSQTRVNALLFNVLVRHEQRLQRIEDILEREGFR